MSRLHFGIVAVVLAVLSFTQCRGMSWSCDAMTGEMTRVKCLVPIPISPHVPKFIEKPPSKR